MEMMTLCAAVATLRVIPNKSQFFQYERVSLRCDRWGNSSGWRVMRNTSLHKNQPCLNLRPGGEGSFFLTLYQSDSGVYWCQSAAGQCSHAVLITVTGPLILESPALPVAEGVDVALRCRATAASASGLSSFYRGGVPVGRSSTGNMTIHNISPDEGGLYKCGTGGAESPESRLTVVARGSAPSPESSCCRDPDPGPWRVLGLVGAGGVAVLLLVALLLVWIWRNHKDISASLLSKSCVGGDDTEVSYVSVVTVSQNLQPRRPQEAAETVYSPVKP